MEIRRSYDRLISTMGFPFWGPGSSSSSGTPDMGSWSFRVLRGPRLGPGEFVLCLYLYGGTLQNLLGALEDSHGEGPWPFTKMSRESSVLWSLCHWKCVTLYNMLCYYNWRPHYIMMTSSNGNIFRATGHLCGEITGPRWIPHTKASDAELLCFLWSASE